MIENKQITVKNTAQKPKYSFLIRCKLRSNETKYCMETNKHISVDTEHGLGHNL